MTECINAAVRDVTQAVCSSGESKAAKRSRRAADAAREFVQDVAEHQTDSEDDEDARPSKAKVAKKAPAACAGGGGGRCKLPRPEGTAICPRCNSDNTKFCYYNNYNIKQPRYLCKGCQRYWTEGGMLRNVAVGSGRRKSKNTQAREAEKAATADAAKQQSMIATGAFDTFQQMLMNPSLAYSASGLGANAAAAAAAAGPVSGFGGAVMTGMTPLPSMMAQPGSFSGFPGAAGVPGFANYPPAKPTDSGRMTATSDPAITALLGGPPTVTTSTVTTFSGRPAAVELKVRDAGDARVKPTDSGAASGPSEAAAALVHGGASPTAAVVGGGLMYGAGGMAGPHSGFQPDWVTAAGQMQIAQQQLQQAAALQAQTHLRAAAVSLGQQQNPYLSGMWPYNTYSAGPSWAAAAYARLGQRQSWQSGGAGSGQQMSGLSGGSSGADVSAGLLPAAPMAAPAPMWAQPWGASAGAPAWGPVGGVPTVSAPLVWPSAGGPPVMDMGILSGSGGSMMSGGSNNSTATLLGKTEASLS